MHETEILRSQSERLVACRLVETLHAELLPACLHRACVFARMSPDNKRDLMQLLGNGLEGAPKAPHLGLHVGFCGDGANDCGALKAAHVGVSLCEAEVCPRFTLMIACYVKSCTTCLP